MPCRRAGFAVGSASGFDPGAGSAACSRVRHAARRRCGVAARGERAAASPAGDGCLNAASRERLARPGLPRLVATTLDPCAGLGSEPLRRDVPR